MPRCRLATAWLLALTSLGAGLTVAALAVTAGEPVPWKPAVLPVLWSVPGLVVVAARPRQPLGWLFLSVAALFAVSGVADAWVRHDGPGGVATTAWAVWWVDRASAVIVPVTLLALLLLPDGRLPSRRWRAPVTLTLALQAMLVLAWATVQGPVAAPDSAWPTRVSGLANPAGVLPESWAPALADAGALLQLPLLLCVPAVAVRLRRGNPEDRAPLVAVLLALMTFVVLVVTGRALWSPVADVVDLLASLFLAVVLVGVVLRWHLTQVLTFVHHATVVTILGLVVAGAYVLAVGLLTAAGPELSRFGGGVVAAVVALAVQPARGRLQRAVDRALHGDRRDPFAAVSRLAEGAHAAMTLPEVLEQVARSVGQSLRADEVRASAYGAGAVVGPGGDPGLPPPVRAVRVPLMAGEREIGSLVVVPPAGRRLRADEQSLLRELGRHAGLAVDAVQLAAQVAEHHRTLLMAREEERRRLGRELHDDLGPTVAGLGMQLGAVRALVRRDPETAVERLATLEQVAASALADIRRVAHRLRPPVLDQVGLSRALDTVAESLDLTVTEATVDPVELPAGVELAVYRIVAEALSNAARHSGSRMVGWEVRRVGEELLVRVRDDGRGIGPEGEGAGAGLGLRSMRERAEELGGTLTVRPGDGGGTDVTALLPLPARDAEVRP